MLTLFQIPNFTEYVTVTYPGGVTTTVTTTGIITSASTQVTAYVPEFLPVIYFALGLAVVVGTILLVKNGLRRSTKKILRR